jgi:hypothetical protein
MSEPGYSIRALVIARFYGGKYRFVKGMKDAGKFICFLYIAMRYDEKLLEREDADP